jgi:hypothetical protein
MMPERDPTAKDIWETLRAKRGPDLVKAVAEEFDTLHQLYSDLMVMLHQIEARQDLAAHMFSLDRAGDFSTMLPTDLDMLPQHLFEPQEGFYGLEYTNEGTPFRWTGPQRSFSFSICVNRTVPLAVELELMTMIDELRQRTLSLFVDGVPLPFRLEADTAGYVGRAVLPVAPSKTITKLTFVVPTTLRAPSPTSDSRELGVAFARLTICRADRTIPASETDGELVAATAVSEASAQEIIGDPDEVHAGHARLIDPADGGVVSRTFSFTAAQIRDGYPGFFDLEFEGSGIPFRWSGRQPWFSFSIPIDRCTPVELTLKVISVVDFERQSLIAVEVDGLEYALKLNKVADGHAEGRLVLPSRFSAGATSLAFKVPVLLRTKGTKGKKVGIAFRELSLQPAPIVAVENHPKAVSPNGQSETDSSALDLTDGDSVVRSLVESK